MDRQLVVFIGPALVLAAVLFGLLFGHLDLGPPGERPSLAPPPIGESARREREEASEPAVARQGEAPAEREAAEPVPAAPAGGPAPPAPVEGGRLAGRVVFARGEELPAAPPALLFGEKASEGCCPGPMDDADRSLVIGPSRGIAWAVVEVRIPGVEADGEGEVHLMDQRCCRFEPHVLVVPKGATVRYRNSDGVTHNVRTQSKKLRAFNDNLGRGAVRDVKIQRDEVFPVECDIHPWMKAYVYASKSPYAAVTGPDGSFVIDGLPPGSHSITVWHENDMLGKGRGEAQIAPGETTEVLLELGAGTPRQSRGRR